MVPRSLGVDLDRRLVPFNDEGDTGDVPILVRRNGLAWADMLKKPRVVVLGEAGSGKTTEFRQQARRLASEGAPAFLLTVQELALHGVPGGLAPGDVGRFAAWQASEEAGYFFIDSIDEARLTDVKLATALKQLERGIFRGLARARVLFSCRVSDWRPQADREALTWSLLPPGEDQVDVDVVALAPLEFDQVGRLVAFLALTDPRPFDPQAFLDAARAEGVRSFLRRPGDVARMIAHWRSTGKFGTLTVLIESDVVASLREHDLNRKPSLDLKRARQAASALAGLAWLTGKTAFAVPDDALGTERAAACIDVAEVLPDFKVEERQDLLTLPIFDPATYGRVRIHHRSVSEYLAAEWLRELVARGMPRSDLEGLLFAAGPEGPVVPQRWMPIAAWIAGCDADVRRRLIAAEPMSFLYAADPAALMPADKAAILDAIAVGYRDRSRRFTSLDGDMVRRFAVGCPGWRQLHSPVNDNYISPSRSVLT